MLEIEIKILICNENIEVGQTKKKNKKNELNGIEYKPGMEFEKEEKFDWEKLKKDNEEKKEEDMKKQQNEEQKEKDDKPKKLKGFKKNLEGENGDKEDYWVAKPKKSRFPIAQEVDQYAEDLVDEADRESMRDEGSQLGNKEDEDDDIVTHKRITKKKKNVQLDKQQKRRDEYMTRGADLEDMLEKKTLTTKDRTKFYVQKPEGLKNQCLLITIIVLFTFIFFLKAREELYQKKIRYGSSQSDSQDDFYEVLEVDSGANSDDIKRQYRKLVIAW